MKLEDLILFEGRDAPLYHGAPWKTAVKILDTDVLLANTKQNVRGERQVKGVSLSRDLRVSKDLMTSIFGGSLVFVINQRKLSQKYQLSPVDFFIAHKFKDDKDATFNERRRRGDFAEAEEFVTGSIKPLHKYVDKIIVRGTSIDLPDTRVGVELLERLNFWKKKYNIKYEFKK